MAKRGRPTTYFDLVQPRLDEIESWAGAGLTREEIAVRLGVNKATLHRYMNAHGDLCDALKAGDAAIVANVEAALAREALSGNVTAIIFFLKNKAPGSWRDRQERDITMDASVSFLDRVRAARRDEGDGHDGG